MINVEHIKEICCSLQVQQNKISETYNELLDSLKLQEYINEIKLELENSENKLKEKDKQIELLKAKVNDLEDHLVLKNTEINLLNKELTSKNGELNKLKYYGNMMINVNKNQYKNILENANKLNDTITGYFNFENEVMDAESTNLGSMEMGEDKDLENDDDMTEVEDENNTKLLININNEFVKITVNLVKLLSTLDNKYVSNVLITGNPLPLRVDYNPVQIHNPLFNVNSTPFTRVNSTPLLNEPNNSTVKRNTIPLINGYSRTSLKPCNNSLNPSFKNQSKNPYPISRAPSLSEKMDKGFTRIVTNYKPKFKSNYCEIPIHNSL